MAAAVHVDGGCCRAGLLTATSVITRAVVLAGGASRRFGRDKLSALSAGVSLLDRVLNACRGAGLDPLVIGREPPAGAHWRGIPDQYPGEGPLAGLITGLNAIKDDLLMVAGDLPDLTPAALGWIITHADTTSLATAPRTDRGIEPCCAVYRRAISPVAHAAFARGERALHRLLTAVDAAIVDLPAMHQIALRNVNYPGDLTS